MAQKRPVAPDTPITAYPTPQVSDIVITLDVDSRLPGYKSLEYGTLYPDQTRFPGAKLISQAPLEDDRFVRRIYATDRVNQEAYNYAIKYSGGSENHPIYIRTYLELRDEYKPFEDGTPDPLFAGARLVDEEAEPADGELNSLYLKVNRVFETLPGPEISSTEINEYGVIETVVNQQVPPGELPDPTGLFVSDSVIAEDVSKATRQRRTMEKLPDPYSTYETVEKNIVVQVKRELLTRYQPLPAPVFTSATMDIQDSPMRFPYVLRTTKELPINPATGQPVLPASRVEYTTDTYTFPGIIYTWKAILKDTGEISVDMGQLDNRLPTTMIVAAKWVTTFHLESDPALDISNLPFFKVETRSWAQQLFDIPANTIHPPAPMSIRGGSVTRGGVVYRVGFGDASNPTNYIPGQELLIGGEIKTWYGNIWVKRLMYVKEPI
jgi:hypothetical protein